MPFTFEVDDEPETDWRSSVRTFLATPPTPPPSGARSFSTLGLDTLKEREGFRTSPYGDAGNLAIGYGQQFWKGKRVTPDLRVTQQEADDEFQRQINETYGRAVLDNLKAPVTQDQLDSLLSVAYNHPPTAQTVIAKLNRGERPTLDDFMASATVGGKPYPLLQERRRNEFAPFAAPSRGRTE